MAKETINQELSGISNNTTSFDVEGTRIPDNSLLCIQRVAVCNETSNSSTATIGILKGNKVYWLETITLTTAGLYYPLKEEVYMVGGVKPVIRFRGTSLNDSCKAFVYGYYIY